MDDERKPMMEVTMADLFSPAHSGWPGDGRPGSHTPAKGQDDRARRKRKQQRQARKKGKR